ILVVTDPVLAILALLPLPFINLTATRFSRTVHPAVLDVQVQQAELATVVEETVAGVRVIKGFGAEEVQNQKVHVKSGDIQQASLRAARIRAKYLPLVEMLPQVGLIIVLAVGGHRALAGQLSPGQPAAFILYITMLIQPLRMLGMT